MNIGDKVKIKRTNTIHEIESIINYVFVESIGNNFDFNKYKLKGLCFEFDRNELDSNLDNEHFQLIGDFNGKTVFIDAVYPNKITEPIKTVPISQILRVGDRMKVKKTGEIGEIFKIKENNEIQLITISKSGVITNSFVYYLEELEIVIPNKRSNKPLKTVPNSNVNDSHFKPIRDYKLEYKSIDNMKVGDIVELKGTNIIAEIVSLSLSYFELKILNTDIIIKANSKDLQHSQRFKDALKEVCNTNTAKLKIGDYVVICSKTSKNKNKISLIIEINDNWILVKLENGETELSYNEHLKKVAFVATWQKEREFYLIENTFGTLSKMDKPEFQEYCEKMDTLNVKYKILE